MNIEQEIRTLLRKQVMEEINGLGIRAAIRQEIEASGITKGKINEMVEKAVDSYVRSVNVPQLAETYLDNFIKETVEETVERYVCGKDRHVYYSYQLKGLLEEKLKRALFEEWCDNYSFSVKVEPKEKEE